MILPANNPEIPWTALIIGIWIPNFYYWGLNQYITQRTLGAKSLKQGQMGILFAAGLKLLIPFIVVFPGIMAFQLYKGQMAITFIGLILAMTIITLLKPLKEPKVLPTRVKIDLKPAPSVVWLGLAIIMATITLYIIFW